MNVDIKNASPAIYQLGANDASAKPTPPKAMIIPTHVPLVFFFGASGPSTKEPVDGPRLLGMYGSETFERTLPYFNHGTRCAEIMSEAGNTMMAVRIIPDDNDTVANTTIYVDLLKDEVPVYTRNFDGSIAYDNEGNELVEKTVEGYRIKIISEVNEDDIESPIGVKTAKPGYMETADGSKSTMYPVYEERGAYKGSKYNNYGFTFNLPTNDNVNQAYMESTRKLPYEYHMFKRESVDSTGTIVKNLFGTTSIQFVFKKDAKDPVLNNPIDIQSITKEWFNLTNPIRSMVYPALNGPYVYESNMDIITSKLMEAEQEYINADVTLADGEIGNTSDWMDSLIDVVPMEQHGLLNLFNCMSTKRIPNFTFTLDNTMATLDDNHTEVFMSKSSPVWLGGGKDGTMDEENFEIGVRRWMDKYLDKNSEVMDPARNLENILYDSGYTVATKKELINFISLRKDTFVGLSTREDNLNEKYVDLITERAITVNLMARLNLAPESTYHGTPVARGMVVAGSGLDIKDPSNRRYGLLMDIAYKSAYMMSGTSWKKERMFDRGDKNTITRYADVKPSFIPEGIKADLWDVGMIWPQHIDFQTLHFPQMQSVYNNDTSVLNNIFMAIALTVTNKVAAATWRKFTGDVSMTTAVFLKEVEDYMNGELDKFDGIIIPTCRATITSYDEQRGYSWTLTSKLAGSMMKTAMIHSIEVWNKDDL